ncbi:MAG TPA: hypothetical protein EYN91_10265 [Candidatus Melainabacteria bacterium]|nr:hypothetical protein [Candidatus Melainabacteria bacterium]
MAEAKKGGGSNGKGDKGKKPKGKESDAPKKSQANPAPKEEENLAAESNTAEEAGESSASEPTAASTHDEKTTASAGDAKTESADSKAEATKSDAKPTETKAAEPEPASEKSKIVDRKPEQMQQQRVSRILDAVLEEPVEETASHHGFKHPLFLDVILAAGLLVAMAGFSIGMFKIYITHSAKQSINQQNYRAAIALLKGTPLPGFFNIAGSEDSVELLNRALYLDAISKLEINRDDPAAIDELQQIRPGSGYFELAQDLLRDNSPPPKLQLEGGASHDADPSDPEVKEDKPIVPDDDVKDASP